MKKDSGFTLIELLVVIVIIGLLIAIGLFATMKSSQVTRDTVRKHEITNIVKNILSFKIEKKEYPADIEALEQNENFEFPKDPKHPSYQFVYELDDSQSPVVAKVCAYLESHSEVWCWASDKEDYIAYGVDDPFVPNSDFLGSSGGGDPTPTPSGSTPTPEPVGAWVYCANEWQPCYFEGTKEVKFGANGSYNYSTHTDGVSCNWGALGDPAPGQSKQCWFEVPSALALSNTYEAVPVIFLASDSDVGDVNTYKSQVEASFADISLWYSEQLGGKTFSSGPAIFYQSSKTSTELHSILGNGIGIWISGVRLAVVTNGMNVCDDHRFYYFVTPMDDIAGGMVGAENFGCNYVLPGTAAIPSQMGRLLGGIIDPDWPEWWADETREARGGVAHELGHGFGGECTNGNVYPGGGCNGLPHSTGPSIMYGWWGYRVDAVFFADEITKVLNSPFIQ